MPALFLTALPAGAHDELDALAALIDEADDANGVAQHALPSAQRSKRQRSSMGQVQVHMALAGLATDHCTAPVGEAPMAPLSRSTAEAAESERARNGKRGETLDCDRGILRKERGSEELPLAADATDSLAYGRG
jgi:type II secretory pathway component HofQ